MTEEKKRKLEAMTGEELLKAYNFYRENFDPIDEDRIGSNPTT